MRHSLLAITGALLTGAASAKSEIVSSPDGSTTIRVEADATRFSISRRGETVIAPSPLGLELDGAADLAALALEAREDVAADRTIPLIATKAARARDHYRGATFTFREARSAARRLFIDVVPTTTASPSVIVSTIQLPFACAGNGRRSSRRTIRNAS